jgi:hypothetical protein
LLRSTKARQARQRVDRYRKKRAWAAAVRRASCAFRRATCSSSGEGVEAAVLGAVGDVAGEGLAKSRRRLAVRRGPPACTAGVRGGASSPSSEGVGSAAAARGRRAAGGGLVARGAVGTSYALRVGVWRLWNMCALRLAATVKPATLHRLAPHASRLMGALPRHNCAKRGKPTQQASQAGSLTNTCRAVSWRVQAQVRRATRYKGGCTYIFIGSL